MILFWNDLLIVKTQMEFILGILSAGVQFPVHVCWPHLIKEHLSL